MYLDLSVSLLSKLIRDAFFSQWAKTTTGTQVFLQVNKYTLSYRFLYGNVQGCVSAKNRPVSLNWTDYIDEQRNGDLAPDIVQHKQNHTCSISHDNSEVYLTVNVFNVACWVFFHALCRLLIYFSKTSFSKNYFRNTIKVSNSLDLGSGPEIFLICVQTVYKGYQQTTPVSKALR